MKKLWALCLSHPWASTGLFIVALVMLTALFVGALRFYVIQNDFDAQMMALRASSAAMISAGCAGKAGLEAQACQREISSKAEDIRRTEADLLAQRQVAALTGIMAVAAWISIPISLAGIFFVRLTLTEMKNQREQADKVLLEAQEGNRISREIAETEHRPYLSIKALQWYYVENDTNLLILRYSHRGNAPARDIRINAETALHIIDGHQMLQRRPPITKSIEIQFSDVGRGEAQDGDFSVPLDPFTGKETADLGGIAELVVEVRLSYATLFFKERYQQVVKARRILKSRDGLHPVSRPEVLPITSSPETRIPAGTTS